MISFAASDTAAIYPDGFKFKPDDYRTAFARDMDVICNSYAFARMGDKTQVFSFYKNDDITRRWLHVQHVGRIAKNIGKRLGLNLDLIEAIALGHDIGHTPFGHKGEVFLSELYQKAANRFFNHNVHSVRILRDRGVSLQVLDGILSHNGEMQITGEPMVPSKIKTFAEFDEKVASTYTQKDAIKKFVANTLEGCLVRICDVLAYVGKDRQDLCEVGLQKVFDKIPRYKHIGSRNWEIIDTVAKDIIANSAEKSYIKISREIATELNSAKKDNYTYIYQIDPVVAPYNVLEPLFGLLFNDIMDDIKNNTDKTYVHRHFVDLPYMEYYRNKIQSGDKFYTAPDIAVDYIAAMTDDYFVDICTHLKYKPVAQIRYKDYFLDSGRVSK